MFFLTFKFYKDGCVETVEGFNEALSEQHNSLKQQFS